MTRIRNSKSGFPTITWAVLVLALGGCERAARYPAPGAIKSPPREVKPEEPHPHWAWHRPEGWREPFDTPIVFIAHGHKDWDALPGFWTHVPHPVAGLRTVHLGQAPFNAVAAIWVADHLEATQGVLKIKVPRGLPDPSSHIPAANPVTFNKWKLGKKIFFDRKLVSGTDTYACATCHQPEHGFTEERGAALRGSRNTLGLINVIYNRQQFWDGRATTLEETLVRTLDDELPASQKQAVSEETHRWGGLVRALGANLDYQWEFKKVFGLEQPTQDAIAKALAAYMRTILSGNSLYDRAEQEQLRRKAPALAAEHFAAVLDEDALKSLRSTNTREAVARQLERGQRLFQTNACVTCHPPPLFTDHEYHNLGVGDSEPFRPAGEEIGRFVHVPVGLKEARLIGAYRTPSLRALPRTGPYFHDGSRPRLDNVVKYFHHLVTGQRAYLAEPLLDSEGRPKRLDMTFEDELALELFLRALDGEAVNGIVSAAQK